ncbi:hypothetical protein [Cohnella sp.]|uniref:hypothetical protein n=1 Tax=Cohnella sp. TaxID=1883426 RepID=UPI00356339F6
MNLKSELLSNVLKILLWVLLSLSAMDLVGTLIYSTNIDFYLEYVYSINNFLLLLSIVLYLVIIVVYLIWIYRVHMDLNNLFVNYPRSPGMSLVCMMVPFYNFYGIPSIYMRIGEFYSQYTSGLDKQGRWISRLAVPLMLSLFVLSGLNRTISNADGEPSTGLWFALGVAELITYSIFLIVCFQVSQGLKIMQTKQAASMSNTETSADWDSPVNEAAIPPIL